MVEIRLVLPLSAMICLIGFIGLKVSWNKPWNSKPVLSSPNCILHPDSRFFSVRDRTQNTSVLYLGTGVCVYMWCMCVRQQRAVKDQHINSNWGLQASETGHRHCGLLHGSTQPPTASAEWQNKGRGACQFSTISPSLSLALMSSKLQTPI